MKQAIGLLKETLRRLRNPSDARERGQALIIVIFGVFALLILVGLAVDLGLYYVERVRLTRAVDAATLAAAYELPLEEAAQLQALDYLRQNGYDPDAANTAVIVDDAVVSPPTSGITRTTIWVNTAKFRDPPYSGAQDSAYRIEVQVRRAVPVIFLRFAGFRNISSQASSVAENVNNLDVVIVFDMSGSMEFDTLCYGCWSSSGDAYPDGDLYPLVWDGPANGTPTHCEDTTPDPYPYNGEDYYFIEAEDYSYASNTYDRDLYSIGYTYWALQRSPSSASARGRDIVNRGAYIMHMPYPDMGVSTGGGVTCRYEELVADVSPADGSPDFNCWSGAPGGPYPAPRVDYNFTPSDTDGYYIWVRGQAAGSWTRSDGLDRRLFWGINGQLGGGSFTGYESNFSRGTGYNGANNNWQWRKLNGSPINFTGGTEYTLNFWAGGAEFAFDRIAITTNSYGSDGSPPSPMTWNSGRGAEEWDNMRRGWACNPCDPRFAGYPADDPDRPGGFDPAGWVGIHPVCDSGPNPDQREDDLYDDEQPMRASIEAAKMFVTELLDPRYDQVGYVRYSTNSQISSELQCLRREGKGEIAECNEAVINSTVVAGLESTTAGGSTNIAGGMRNGLQVLSTFDPHNGRAGATHVMIVMTDGQANVSPNSTCYSDPSRQWLDGAGSNAQDCVIYYAHEARDDNVIVYTITIGVSADFELMQAVADMTGGVHRNADRHLPGALRAHIPAIGGVES
jgi:hypothetical protein